ncbi:Ti-type conjugative transfer relaxase TraA [Sphingomonas koreensis]|uniref:Ti-type conjugative transfer relaxase TraA n=1 Tax=Sphingomonas koreensis TaxID=93064 RepID=UPI00082F0EC2|nr:Ti-type conjugative transfer relaxase TraA [Sphingomonas koreensis]PJI88462.1 Ti-type conjugative transfer relaxase TraA [Sphingomonas koreensis]RSU55441.1 Ti-type conjugative transfer relaxase TraA [Sphingomonas koreensis]RSU64052.1 Ti-type conjugative transfer relaxase TraA [Sphingomonas koreensis]
MAIYHFSAKIISRANGSSALASAAYRSGSRLYDERLDRHHDFSNKAGVVHSEVMLPDSTPEHFADREKLWNAVEAAEKRIDSQLAREVEFAIPRELSPEMGIDLAREFVRREFVDRGMIADLNVHWDIGADGLAKPHAHVMLTLREVGEDGFGKKNRDWNRADLLEKWRERWAEHVNQRLAELDIDARIDHRSLEAQGIDLEPQHKIGPAASRMAAQGLASERLEEHHAIARANGEKLLANPALAIDAITHNQATFTTRDLAMFVHRHSEGKEQFDRVMAAVKAAPELVALGKDRCGEQRFTSRAMIETEQRLERAASVMANRHHHAVADHHRDAALARAAARGMILSSEQRSALEHVTETKGLGIVIGYAGTGKSAMLGVARDAWESAGYSVRGAALSGIAAENLESGSGIASRTIASMEHQWAQGRELLTDRDVLVIDEAGMIGTRQMERVISGAQRRGAKVVLVGDPEQLQAIEAGAAFRATAERHGGVEITQIRRQREDWQRDATRQLATGRTAEAIAAYEDRGRIHAADTRDQARGELIERWDRDRRASPGSTRIILTHTNDEVRALNIAARERLRSGGELGEDVTVRAERGERAFAAGDRVMFLRNERSLGVKNGTLGKVESVTPARMAVTLDDGRAVGFDVKDYASIDHGYAATVHKAQGVTVDHVHVLATPGIDRHAAYVALSRHRDAVDAYYGRDDFADPGKLVRALSRERGKDMASDYQRVPEPAHEPSPPRNPFAGLKLGGAPAAEPQATSLDKAVERYARAAAYILRMRNRGVEELPHHRTAFARASRELDAIRPDAARDLRNAFNADHGLIDQAANGRTAAAIRAMALEAELRIDGARRADQFVAAWQQNVRRLHAHERSGDYDAGDRIRSNLADMAKSLHRDPQLESLLRNRVKDLGIGKVSGSSISHELLNSPGLSRGRGLSR